MNTSRRWSKFNFRQTKTCPQRSFSTTADMFLFFCYLIITVSLRLLYKLLAVEYRRIFKRCDQCEIFCHLSRLDRIYRCFFQLIRKLHQFGIAVKFSSFSKRTCPCKIVATEFVDVSSPLNAYSSGAEQFREPLHIHSILPVKREQMSSSPTNQRQKTPYHSSHRRHSFCMPKYIRLLISLHGQPHHR